MLINSISAMIMMHIPGQEARIRSDFEIGQHGEVIIKMRSIKLAKELIDRIKDDSLESVILAFKNVVARHYTEDGDMISSGQRFRQVGWRINGGEYDGWLIRTDYELQQLLAFPHGSYSPIYVEVGND